MDQIEEPIGAPLGLSGEWPPLELGGGASTAELMNVHHLVLPELPQRLEV
jgi:hypothetical protein